MPSKSSERLPAGWTVRFKAQKNGRKIKCYMNRGTGQTFFSKEDLLRYVKVERTLHEPKPSISSSRRPSENSDSKVRIPKPNSDCSQRHSENSDIKVKIPKPISDCSRRHSENSNIKPVANENEHPDWLPDGWVVDLKTRKSGVLIGRPYKIYTDPLTGCKFFSKPEVLRYLESAKRKNCSSKQKETCNLESAKRKSCSSKRKETCNLESAKRKSCSSKWKETRNLESAKRRSCSSKRKETRKKMCSASKVVVEKSTVDDLPPGWIKETKIRKNAFGVRRDPYYTDPVSGYVFRSKKDVFRYLETGEISRHAFKPAKRDAHDLEALVVVEKSTVDDLPPGWIKETKIRKNAFGVRRDPYYTDPVSGYVFRSKKDVFRYLETGEISRHAFKPSKRDAHDLEALPSPAAKRQKLEHPATRRRLFSERIAAAVKESSEACSSALPEVEALKKRQGNRVSAETGLAGAATAEIFPEKMVTEKGSEAKKTSSFGYSVLSKPKVSKGNQGNMTFADNGPVSTPATDTLQGKNSLECGIECGSGIYLKNSNKSEDKKKLNLPRRSSKRLAGHEPELVVDNVSIERVCKKKTAESCKSEAISAADLASNGLAAEVSKKLNAGPVIDMADCVSSEVDIPSNEEQSHKIKPSRNKPIPGQQMHKMKSAESNDDKSEPHLSFPFGHSYLDPCLEFAFKTLTGEIPVDGIPDNIPVSTPAADILQGKSLQQTNMEKCSARKVDSNSIKSNLPRRSSKRLAGFEPELVPDLTFSERALFNATRKFKESEALMNAGLCPNGLEDGASHYPDAGHITTHAHHSPADMSSPLHEQSSSKINKPLELQSVSEGQPQQVDDEKPERRPQHLENEKPEGQPQQMENEKPEGQPQQLENKKMNNENSESQPVFPFGDSWSDPCLEFAFKTLTGAIPVDDNLAIQDYFQHQLHTSQTWTVSKPELPDFSICSSFQADVSFQLDVAEKKTASQQQLPVNPSLPPSGNVSLPSCSIASQQPCLEGNKEMHGKVKS
ncbi:uncharacterized protein LOC116136796 [Pistacia vera]|uniref:uncharacterized protein LOC116136796 n=1 Tax=Pistacia vera TaxID=55513 RepID=UPI001263668F|nr:uncharacterized protein LOC116136796 [Pistacia vera]